MYQTSWYHIQKNSNVHSHTHENLRSHMLLFCSQPSTRRDREFSLLGYIAVEFTEIKPTFQGNIWPLLLQLKNKKSNKPAEARSLTSNRLNGIIFQTTELFVTTTVRPQIQKQDIIQELKVKLPERGKKKIVKSWTQ